MAHIGGSSKLRAFVLGICYDLKLFLGYGLEAPALDFYSPCMASELSI